MYFSAPTPYQGQLWAGRTVGLLGGSFNPAHDGHRHISLHAIKRLGLDAVWWMVSPQNPIKPVEGMAPLQDRLRSAAAVSDHPRIIATDIESQMGTRYTIDTLRQLTTRFAATNFIWLMGSDNLRQFHLWHEWEEIFHLTRVCVLDRPPRPQIVQSCAVIERFRHHLVDDAAAASLKSRPLPAWVMLHIPLSHESSTAIRAGNVDKTKKPR